MAICYIDSTIPHPKFQNAVHLVGSLAHCCTYEEGHYTEAIYSVEECSRSVAFEILSFCGY